MIILNYLYNVLFTRQKNFTKSSSSLATSVKVLVFTLNTALSLAFISDKRGTLGFHRIDNTQVIEIINKHISDYGWPDYPVKSHQHWFEENRLNCQVLLPLLG